ncbi:hypothetical protein JYU34_006167 [Plutella xylostella]|uniref:SEFIR domain-containing protein n=1 Tax=Plutella xylostella TaxID=51655 RepID=A0ABQ7QV05_PLUXY|nr:hypothetical protein JYU34_006167 [Plutella xylostella]
MKLLISYFALYFLNIVSGDNGLCGDTSVIKTRSCSTQIIGDEESHAESCVVKTFPPNSTVCKDMSFGPITSNTQIGGVSLKPYVLFYETNYNRRENLTVLNITFSNIKWKNMKFRFQRRKDLRNHCRNINIARNVTINDQSVLYYDCYWSMADYSGQSHILDFEATDDNQVVNRGQYYFNIPSAAMLSPMVKTEDWKPFVYIEIHTSTMKLHILPPPTNIKIRAYRIEVMRENDKGFGEEIVKNSTVKLKNTTSEVIYEYSLLRSPGSYYFLVVPLHDMCLRGDTECQMVDSPRITITNEVHQTLNICIASVTALVVATLFAYYIVLRLIRRYWCKDYRLAIGNELLAPPRILVIYSSTNKLHAECVSSFVAYLRAEYGFDIMYDGDIASTSHADPFIWAQEAFNIASNIVYIVGPAEEANIYNNIYDQPIISPHRDVDALLLSFLQMNRGSRNGKDVVNVFFEHSNGSIPIETKMEKKFVLLKDWQKMIAFLSKNMPPKHLMMKSDKGKCFLEDLKRAKKLLSVQQDDVVIKCDKLKTSPFEKKVLL